MSEMTLSDVLDKALKAEAMRAEAMPTEQDAVRVMFEAYQRLQELGWRPAIYAPKNGSTFDAIEPGSAGIGVCSYMGDWPNGAFWMHEGGDLWPSRPALFRPRQERES